MSALEEIDEALADATMTKDFIADARQDLVEYGVCAEKRESEKLRGRIAFADWLAEPTLKQAEGALRDKRADLQKIQGLRREMERAERAGDLQAAAGFRRKYLECREAVRKDRYVRDLDNAHSVIVLVGLLRHVLGPRDDEGDEEQGEDEDEEEEGDEEGDEDDEEENEEDQSREAETGKVMWTMLEEQELIDTVII